MYKTLIVSVALMAMIADSFSQNVEEGKLQYESINGVKTRNVIFILSDDHRWDFLGFTGKIPWLKTPAMDRLAREGVFCRNTYVTTSLCSPSRASILTGLYSHTHEVVDNQAPVPEGLLYFPQYIQDAGFQTAFFGKWHMGDHNDNPRPGFNHWESFMGQGTYYAPKLNINGEGSSIPIRPILRTCLPNMPLIGWRIRMDKNLFSYTFLIKQFMPDLIPPVAMQGCMPINHIRPQPLIQ
jgi:hypothetical protein